MYSLLLHRWRGRRNASTSITSTLASTAGESSIGEDVIGDRKAAGIEATDVQARLLCEALCEFVCSSNAALKERLERHVEYVFSDSRCFLVFALFSLPMMPYRELCLVFLISVCFCSYSCLF